MTLVSVVIPTFDRADLVGRAVDSVLAQTHAELECVVVDDGSRDATAEVLAARRDPRLRVLFRDHGGVSTARNAGAAASRGRMLAFLDSDDEWLPRKLERHLAFALGGGRAVSQTQEIWMRGGRRVNPRDIHRKEGGQFFERALAMCLVSPSSVMLTRELFERTGGFDPSLPACEDYDLWLRILVTHPVALLDEPLTVRHGGRPDQLSARTPNLDVYRIRSLVRLLGHPEATDWHRDCIKKELWRKTRIYVQGCRKRGRDEAGDEIVNLVLAAAGPDPDAFVAAPGRPEP